MNIELILVAFGLILFVIMVYSYMRDSENSRQIRFLANTMDNFNKQLFALERKVEKLEIALKAHSPQTDINALEQKMQRELSSMAEPIAFSLTEIESAIAHFKKQMEARIEHVEDGIKSIAMPKSMMGLDDQKIVSLYKQGMDKEAIAKELAISKSEVEFALKIARMQ